MDLTEFAQYAFVVFLYLVLLAFIFSAILTVMSLWVLRKSTQYSTDIAKKLMSDLEDDLSVSDFDYHVATTPGMIDDTND